MTKAEENIIQRLDELFPDKNALTTMDVVKYTGLSIPTVKKKFGLGRSKTLDKMALATMLAEGAV